MSATDERRRLARLPPIRVGAVVALALAAAFVAWLATRTHGTSGTATAPTSPTEVSPASLRTLGRSLGHRVYWAGQRARSTYELTRGPAGQVYVRYLPKGVAIGEHRTGFLTVASYPETNALASIRSAGRARGTTTLSLPGHGLAVIDPKNPTNVHLAYPGSGVQVEVYDPRPGVARRLVLDGRIVPVAGPSPSALPAVPPRLVSPGVLRSLSATSGHAVFWLGTRPGRRLEFTRTARGAVYVRYLPRGMAAGERLHPYLTVATYRQARPLRALKVAARRPGIVALATRHGGRAIFARRRPTNVYVAYPGAPVQVELYAPVAAQARRLAQAGRLRPVAIR